MPMIRGTFFFKDTAGAGWSETFYSTLPNLTAALAAVQRLVPTRVALLGSQGGLYEARVSDDLVKRDSQIYVVPPDDVSPLRSSASNFGSDNVVVRMEADNGPNPPFTVRRTLALRGTPVNITGPAGVFQGNNLWSVKFGVFGQQLFADSWAIKYRDKLATAFQILLVTQALPSGVVTITTVLPTTFAIGQQVLISGCVGATQINGLWTILTAPTNLTFTIKTNQIVGTYLGNGQATANPYLLSVISNIVVMRMGTHRVGRPFDAPRGRRRGRVRR